MDHHLVFISLFQILTGAEGLSRFSIHLNKMRQHDLVYNQKLVRSKRVTFHKVTIVSVTKATVCTAKEWK